MPVTILRSTEPVRLETVIIMEYGEPGSGKTSLACSARSPLLLDFDGGAYRSRFRCDSVPIGAWSDVEQLAEADLKPYRTIAVDTVGRCLDVIATRIMDAQPKLRGPSGQLTLQGFGALKSEFAGWLRGVRAYGRDVVLVAHGVEQRSGDDLIIRPDVMGGSYGEVMKVSDGVAYLRMVGNRRILAWDPLDRSVGKNPAGLEPCEVPDLATSPQYLGGVIDAIKARVGQVVAASAAVRGEVDVFRAKVEAATGPEHVAALIAMCGDMKGAAQRQAKALVAARAKTLGLTWDAGAKAYSA